MNWETKIFQNHSPRSFEDLALEIFQFQATNNIVYKTYLNYLGIKPGEIKKSYDIPYLPIELFKTHEVICEPNNREATY